MKPVFAVLFASLLFATAGFAVESSKTLSKKQLQTLIEKASTPADHNKLAHYYSLQADKFEAEAKEHADMAKMYRARPGISDMKRPMSPDTAGHCETLAENLHKAATEARALSAAHAEMAKK